MPPLLYSEITTDRSALLAGTYITHRVIYYPLVPRVLVICKVGSLRATYVQPSYQMKEWESNLKVVLRSLVILLQFFAIKML